MINEITEDDPEFNIFFILNEYADSHIEFKCKVLDDGQLSWGAKGLWAYLIGKPDNWKVSVAHLSKIYDKKCGGEKAIYSLLNEMIEQGYCTRTQPNGGSFGEVEYVILEFKNCLPHSPQADALDVPHTNKGDLPINESSSKAQAEKEETKDDDLVFNDFQREQLNNFTADQILEATKRTQDCCKSRDNRARVKFFFTTITNLQASPKKVKPYDELKRHFKHGEFYNQAECFFTETAISFSRGMRHESIDFKYFKWDNFQKLCDGFGIEFKR